jgi:hypothetical protein
LCALHGNPGAIVHQQKVGLGRGRERDGCPFALIEECECGVGSWWSGHDGQPAGRGSHPLPYGGRRYRITEFVAHDGRD